MTGFADEIAAMAVKRVLSRGTDGTPEMALMTMFKAAPEQRYTLGLAYGANLPDVGIASDGYRDAVGPEALERAAWQFMKGSRNIGLFHKDGSDFDQAGQVVESYIWRAPTWRVDGTHGAVQTIQPGDWLMGVVWSEQAWPLVQKGLIKGFSPQGAARRGQPSPERLAALRRRDG